MNISKDPFKELKEIMIDFLPDVVGISIRNIDSTNKRKVVFYYSFLKDTIDIIKKYSKAKVVVGGSGFSMFSREIMEDEPRIDFGVFLEGEVTFPMLLRNLDRPQDVSSVFYRKNGKVVFSGPGERIDLNSIESPDRLFVSMDNYKDIPESVGVETKRGCILNCTYCIYGFLNGKELRLREPLKVVDEIELLVNEHGVQRFTFIDSVFNIPKKHAEKICAEIIQRRIKVNWSAWFIERGLTREFVEMIMEAGCKNIILSPDGFSNRVLKKLGKNLTKKDITDSYKILKDFDDIEVSYNFFKNPPGQSFKDFFSIVLFCVKAKLQMKRRVHFEFNSLRIEPHTRLYQIALDEGFVEENESLLYPKYYTNLNTILIDNIFNLIMRISGK